MALTGYCFEKEKNLKDVIWLTGNLEYGLYMESLLCFNSQFVKCSLVRNECGVYDLNIDTFFRSCIYFQLLTYLLASFNSKFLQRVM